MRNNTTLVTRNPPPLTVDYAPLGAEGLAVYIQQKKERKKNNNNLIQGQIMIPVGFQIFRRTRRIEKHMSMGVVERMSQRNGKPIDYKYTVVQLSS
jgi:hypothetical protein